MSFVKYYILQGQTPVIEPDMLKWSEWSFGQHSRNRKIKQTKVGASHVSTVFIGIDHDYSGKGPPILFETMVFGGPMDGEQHRCSFYNEAVRMHDQTVKKVRAAQRTVDDLKRLANATNKTSI